MRMLAFVLITFLYQKTKMIRLSCENWSHWHQWCRPVLFSQCHTNSHITFFTKIIETLKKCAFEKINNIPANVCKCRTYNWKHINAFNRKYFRRMQFRFVRFVFRVNAVIDGAKNVCVWFVHKLPVFFSRHFKVVRFWSRLKWLNLKRVFNDVSKSHRK